MTYALDQILKNEKTDSERSYYMDLKILTDKQSKTILIQNDLLEYLKVYLNGMETHTFKPTKKGNQTK